MPKKFQKFFLIFGIFIIFAAIPTFWLTFKAAANLEVNFLDVGQGDSALIKTPFGQNILIDGGPDNAVVKKLGEELSWWDKNIDLIILTHPHDDHVSGLVDILNRYKVKKILYTGVTHDSPNYLAWLEIVRDKKISLTIIDHPQTIKFGDDCRLEILYPLESLAGKTVENLNNSSIVSELVYKKNRFLFMGDAEIEVEEELIGADITPQPPLSGGRKSPQPLLLKGGYDILKVGHHGSDTSSSEEFLDLVQPKIAVISVGAENDFGHPSRRILKRLERIGAEIFRTDLGGTVRIVSDGEKIYVK
jgi:competence protein ComEC